MSRLIDLEISLGITQVKADLERPEIKDKILRQCGMTWHIDNYQYDVHYSLHRADWFLTVYAKPVLTGDQPSYESRVVF